MIAKAISNDSSIPNYIANEISVKCEDGVTRSLKVGDFTYVTTTGTDSLMVRIIGFKHDDLVSSTAYETTNTSTKAGITFEFVDILIAASVINESDINSGGWGATAIRTTLNSTDENSTLNNLMSKNNIKIKQVTKAYCAMYNDAALSYSDDYLWFLSSTEVYGSSALSGYASGYTIGTEGTQYKYYAKISAAYDTGNDALKKPSNKTGTSSSGSGWYLRSVTNNNLKFCQISGDGLCCTNMSGWQNATPGFCI
jgi:hypothetical protein